MQHWHAFLSEEKEAPPTTGGFLASMLLGAIAPSLTTMVTNAIARTALQHSLSALGAPSDVLSRLVNAPLYLLSGHTPHPHAGSMADSLLHSLLGGPPATVLPSMPQHLPIILLALTTLLVEYVGMTEMQRTFGKTKLTLVANADDDSLVSRAKRTIHDRYAKSAFYTQKNAPAHLEDTDAVRTVYNLLVGLNMALFKVTGGRSADPDAEIVHWGAVWIYWEVLVRLVGRYGWSPVGLASAQLLKALSR